MNQIINSYVDCAFWAGAAAGCGGRKKAVDTMPAGGQTLGATGFDGGGAVFLQPIGRVQVQ